MSKTVSPFSFNGIVEAALAAAKSEGAFVRSIVDAREPLRGTPSATQVDECCVAIAAAFGPDADKKSFGAYVSTAKALLSCPMDVLLAACQEGMGRNGVYRRVNDAMKPADSTVPKRGRPAKQGAGKTTAPAAVNSGAGADPINPMIECGIITQHVAHARSAMATCLKWKENGRGLSTAQVDEIKEHYAMIAAILGTLTAKPAK